ncbi:MAG: 4-hydroxy-tetrahydrodipicolinate synthase [Rhodobacterales bacterium]|nr:MAG: 4-hydroxy-tetrahydrodipicolinate synthase [Rhodobacterales bacterium]
MTPPPHSLPQGIWLPLITPFRNGALDEPSFIRLLEHCATQPLSGLILGATSGEGPALSTKELTRLIDIARRETDLPVWVGLSGMATAPLIDHARALPQPDGWLVTPPSYFRPSQEGIAAHIRALLGAVEGPVMLYNIPYRTGIGMTNALLRDLAREPRIVGLKDCSGDADQSRDLMLDPPDDFSVMTGEDGLFLTAILHGARGAVLVSAHLLAPVHARIMAHVAQGDFAQAHSLWREVDDIARLIFAAPSPAPIKHLLWRRGIIDSPELRLPMTAAPAEICAQLDAVLDRLPS